MEVEDYQTRLGDYCDRIMKYKMSILRLGLELSFVKKIVVDLKDKLVDKIEYIDTLEYEKRK